MTGHYEKQLPEARRGIFQARTLDEWPFIFKKFHEKDYETVLSEDDPSISAFQYRFNGFRSPPTSKYLRPWWLAADSSLRVFEPSCNVKIGLDYLKQFFEVYEFDKKFGLFIFSSNLHNDMSKAAYIDKIIFQFFQFMENKKNTIIFFMGDHGYRVGEIRETLQGQLEHRLPMMSITIPTILRQKYKYYWENLQKNSQVLTTNFDIYTTLRHLITFPERKFEHDFARSLFTDIAKLNRSCIEAGISIHYCPCVSYNKLKTQAYLPKAIAKEVVEHINTLLEQRNDTRLNCAQVSLHKIFKFRLVDNKSNFEDNYNIMLSVKPSNGRFEATVVSLYGKLSVVAINRLNLYADQSACIARKYPHLREYCFCA